MAQRKVTKEEFFAAIGPKNCHPSILPGPYPYTSAFKMLTPPYQELGRIVGRAINPGVTVNDYFLND